MQLSSISIAQERMHSTKFLNACKKL